MTIEAEAVDYGARRALDRRLRALGFPARRSHRTHLVRYGDKVSSAVIPCHDPTCTMCNPPRRQRPPLLYR